MTRQELLDKLVEVSKAPDALVEKLTKSSNPKFFHLFSSYTVRPVAFDKEPFRYKERELPHHHKPYFKNDRKPKEVAG